ncbi:MAG TPA: AAC(3) family N-acetyltransferase [Polyangiaceae bacterium]|jgi:aminoglycoside 3-N-acetyltransferase
MAHASMRSVGGDVNDLVRALVETAGTVMAYVDWEMESDDETFDPATARAKLDHGILAETIRTWPGAVRSAHPDAGMAAIGERAVWLVADHPFQYGYGEGSPLDKLVRANGKVLVLGAPLDTITLLHFSEHAARIPEKRIARYRRRMKSGFVDFEEFDTCDPVHASLAEDFFGDVARDYLATGRGITGMVGRAKSYAFDAADLHRFAVAWIERKLA